MCVDKKHGGRRCPNDTSASRRQRRKASTLLDKMKQEAVAVVLQPSTEVSTLDKSDFLTEAADIKTLIGSPPPAGVSQSDYDMQVEKRITDFGVALADEAEKRVGYSPESLQKKIDALDSVYDDIRAREQKHTEDEKALLEEMNAYRASRSSSGNNEQVKFDDDEGIALLDRTTVSALERRAIQRERYNVSVEHANQVLRLRNNELDKLSAAYQEVLAEIRPLGGEVRFAADHSNSAATELLQRTVGKHYPSEWLEHHNNASGEVVVEETFDRPNYANRKEDKASPAGDVPKEKPPIYFSYTIQADNENQMKVWNTVLDVFKDSSEVQYSYEDAFAGATHKQVIFLATPEEEYQVHQHGELTETELRQQGWEYRPSLTRLDRAANMDDTDRAIEIVKTPCWVRKTFTQQPEIKVMSLSTIDKNSGRLSSNSKAGRPSEAIAYHEFGHRMEEVMPDSKLTRYERAFLKRRTGKTDENFNENMRTNFGNELYHDGGFVYSYTGRAYVENFFEVFTTGIEAVYGGNLGGLVGNSPEYETADKDHRGFVLGALATL